MDLGHEDDDLRDRYLAPWKFGNDLLELQDGQEQTPSKRLYPLDKGSSKIKTLIQTLYLRMNLSKYKSMFNLPAKVRRHLNRSTINMRTKSQISIVQPRRHDAKNTRIIHKIIF